MVDLPPLLLIATQLRKARGSSPDIITIFGRLPLVIFMGNFYQFAPVLGKAFWNKAIGEKKLHRKSL